MSSLRQFIALLRPSFSLLGKSALLGGLIGTSALVMQAQTYRTWDDGKSGSDDWSQKNNWSNNNLPGGSTEVAKFAGSNAGTTSVDVNSNQRTGGVLFNSDLSVDISFTRANRELSIRNGGANYGIINNSSRTLTFENMMGIEANMTWSSTSVSGGGMIFENIVDTDGYDLTFLTTNAANTITVSGEIKDSGDIIKTGAGTLTLSGANTYTGDTTINGGKLIARNDDALGDTSGNTTIGASGTLELQNSITIGSGESLANSGSLLNASGANTYEGVISGSGATTVSGGSLTLSATNTYTGGTTVDGGTLVLTSGGGSGTIRGDLTINSGGTVNATATDAFGYSSGQRVNNVTIDGGTLNNNITSTNGNLGWGTQYSLNDGALMSSNSGVSSTSTNSNFTFGDGGALEATSGTSTIAGRINLRDDGGATNYDFTVASGANLNVTAGVTSTGTVGLTKDGAGTMTLSGNNTYTGTTTVSGGTLVAAHNNALGANTANAIVNSGGTISLDGGVTVTKTSGTLSLNSSGASASTGALHAGGSTGTTSEWIGNIALTGDSTISAADNLLTIGDISTLADTLNLNSYTLTLNTPSSPTVTPTYTPYPSYPLDPTNILINSVISGTGGIDKIGTGTATILSGNKNTFTGDTNITGGKLIVDGSGFYNSPVISSSNVTIGNASGAGAADSVILQMGQLTSPGAGFPTGTGFIGTFDAGTLTASTALTIYEDGLFDMNGGENSFSGITLKGGHITGRDPSSSPLLTIAGDVTTLASSQTALIEEGEVGMSKNGFTFNIADGAADVDLQIDSILHNGIGYTASTTSTINKTGDGTMVLTGNNDYVGITQVQQGILNIQNNTALGQSSTPFGSTGNGTVVSSGAQLQIEGGLTVGNETLSLSGTGIGNTGALLNKADNNTYNGYVILDADARINANAGTTLNIANTSGVNAGILNGASAGKNLTVGGSGDTIINGSIGSYVNNITKDGTGTLTLAGYNGYAGATNVTSGAVKITHDNGLSGTGAIVTSGAALQFAQDATNADIDVVGVNATINGTGLSNGGAIQNLNGDNSYLGAITLGSDSRITAEAGSSLTLNGNVNAAGHNLDAGGAGDTTYNGIISGSGSTVTKTDTGTVTIGGTSANTFTGGLNINEGTVNLNKTAGVNAVAGGTVTVGDSSGSANSANLVVQANNQMADSTDLVLNSDGRIQMGTAEDAISTIAGTGQIDLGASGRLIIGDDNSSSTFGGSITSDDINGTLEKNGSGTLTLTSDISYDGTLELGGGTLKLSDIDLTVGALVITADTTIDFSGVSTLNVGTFSFLSTSYTLNIINWDKNVDFFYSAAWTGGTQDTTGILPMNQVVFDGFLGDQTIWDSYDDEIYPTIPEPSTYGMIFFGACSLLFAAKRFRGKRKNQPEK